MDISKNNNPFSWSVCEYLKYKWGVAFLLLLPLNLTITLNEYNIQYSNPHLSKMNSLSTNSNAEWLSAWQYRYMFTFEKPPEAGTNFNLPFYINYNWQGCGQYATGTVDYGINALCQPDFDDIRFTAADGFTLLDYWCERSVLSDYAIFWVEISADFADDVSIFLYYGNNQADTISNGNATFVLFDDFERPNSTLVGNGWNEDEGGGEASIENGMLKIEQYEDRFCHIEKDAPQLTEFTVHTRLIPDPDEGPAISSHNYWSAGVIAYWGTYSWYRTGRSYDHLMASIKINASIDTRGSEQDLQYYPREIDLRIVSTGDEIGSQYSSSDGKVFQYFDNWGSPATFMEPPKLIILGRGYSDNQEFNNNADLDNSRAESDSIRTTYFEHVFVRKYASDTTWIKEFGEQETNTNFSTNNPSGPILTNIPFWAGSICIVSIILVVIVLVKRQPEKSMPPS